MHKHGGDIYQYPNFIDFSANINLLGVPPNVLNQAKSAMDGILHYPQPGCERLRKAISEMEQVDMEQIICGNGAAELIFSLALAEKPKKALLFAPTFHEYEQALKTVGCEICWEYLEPGQGFRLLEHNLRKITPEVDMVFLCNPNNPTGILTEAGMLKRLLERCRQAGALLAVDECFLDFVSQEPGQQPQTIPASCSVKKYLKEYPNLFIIKAFTKTFGMPGLRLGYGFCGDEARLDRIREATQPWNVSVPAQEAGIAAAREEDFLRRTRQAVSEEKAYLRNRLPDDLIQIYGHAANFIFFRSKAGLAQDLKQYGILIRDCSNFRGLEEGWYRIAVRTRRENELLVKALKKNEKK